MGLPERELSCILIEDMALEISLRSPFAIPRFLRAQDNDAPQHWVGQAQSTSPTNSDHGSQENNRRPKKREQGYRPLADIEQGEVKAAFKRFENQLIPAQENWIGDNCFCAIPLKRIRDGRPPMIFGRITSCFPSDGYLENIEDVELLFPGKNELPDKVRLFREDISRYSQQLTQSYYMRVQFKSSAEERADFAGADPLFSENGFYPDFDSGYFDLLEMNFQTQSSYPWMYVIGSRWFDSIPDSIQVEIRLKLQEMLQWGKHIFNYHPDWLPKEVNTLNRILGFKHEFTPTLLIEPANPRETSFIVQKVFDRDIFPRQE